MHFISPGSAVCIDLLCRVPLLCRDVRYFGGLLRALMASRQHTSTNCQNNISSICLQVASRFKHPRALKYDSPEYVQLQDDLLSLGEPGTCWTLMQPTAGCPMPAAVTGRTGNACGFSTPFAVS